MEAAERRMKQEESRGIKDPEKLKRQQQRLQELEKRHEEADKSRGKESSLRWQVS